MITVFSFARNGWVNYWPLRVGITKDGQGIPFRQVRPNDFVYRNKSDALAMVEPSDEIAAIPLTEPMAKVVMQFDV